MANQGIGCLAAIGGVVLLTVLGKCTQDPAQHDAWVKKVEDYGREQDRQKVEDILRGK
jgi:hypothetical protein